MTQHDNDIERALRDAPEPVPYTDLQPSLDKLITLAIEYRTWYHGPRKQALEDKE